MKKNGEAEKMRLSVSGPVVISGMYKINAEQALIRLFLCWGAYRTSFSARTTFDAGISIYLILRITCVYATNRTSRFTRSAADAGVTDFVSHEKHLLVKIYIYNRIKSLYIQFNINI